MFLLKLAILHDITPAREAYKINFGFFGSLKGKATICPVYVVAIIVLSLQ